VRRTASVPRIIVLTLLATALVQGKKPDVMSDVVVCLHNSVVAGPGVVERAKQVARNMFASVGVNIIWPGSGPEPQQASLSVDVLLTSAEPGDDDTGPLAEAYPFAGSTGHVTVKYDRVRTSAGPARDLEPVLLAHVLVHEITHILQCLDRHAETGIMKAHWTAEDYYEMRWKPLTFTPEDVELLRLGMQVLQSRAGNLVEPGRLARAR